MPGILLLTFEWLFFS